MAASRVVGGEKVVGGDQAKRSFDYVGRDYARPAGLVAVAAGLIYLIGHALDFGILWVLQRQPGLQWEFVALTRTVDAFPDLIVATALLYVGLQLGGRLGPVSNRLLGSLVVFLGLGGLAIMALMVLNYLGMRSSIAPTAAATVQSAVLKTLCLAALYAVVLIPAGIISLRAQRR